MNKKAMERMIIKMNFDPYVAYELDTDSAIILENIIYWIMKNKADERKKYFKQGKWWTFSSIPSFRELFPYLTEKQIKVRLKKLQDAGYIQKGNFNKNKYDKTTWYSMGKRLTPNGQLKSLGPFGPIDGTKHSHREDLDVPPILNCNTNYKRYYNHNTPLDNKIPKKENTQTLKSKRTPESKNLIKNNEDSQTSESPQTSESSQTLDNHPLYQLIGKRHSRRAKKGKWSANRKPSRERSHGEQFGGDQPEEEIKVRSSHGLKPLTYPELYNIAWRLKVPMKAVERIYDQLLFSVENGNPYKVTDIKQRLGMWVANELRKGELVKVTEPGYELDLVVLRDDDSPVGRFKSIIRQFFMALSEMTPEEKSGQEFEELKKKVVKLKHKYFPDGKIPQEIKDYLKKFIE